MSSPSVSKRIRTTENVLKKNLPAWKRARYERKLAFLRGLSANARFRTGGKVRGEGGWR